MLIGIDKVIAMMPSHLNDWTGKKVDEGFWWDVQHDGAHIRMGPYAKKVSDTYTEMVITLVKNGHNVIVDEVCDQERLSKWRQKLAPYKVVYVHVTAPLDVLIERELKRGDRMIGGAMTQYKMTQGNYDLEIDTSKLTHAAILEKIKQVS